MLPLHPNVPCFDTGNAVVVPLEPEWKRARSQVILLALILVSDAFVYWVAVFKTELLGFAGVLGHFYRRRFMQA